MHELDDGETNGAAERVVNGFLELAEGDSNGAGERFAVGKQRGRLSV